MPKQAISLRGMAVAAIAAVVLSLPMISVAQAQQRSARTPAARTLLKHRDFRAPPVQLYMYDPIDMDVTPDGYDPWTPRFERPWPGGPGYYGSNGG